MILFQTLDLDFPIGGTRVAYAMADTLSAAGMEAAVWHGRPGPWADWFEHGTRVVHGLQRELAPGDLLVVPAVAGAGFQPLSAGARVVMLNQGHFQTFTGFGPPPAPGRYPGWPNAVGVLVVSEASERFLRAAMAPDPVPLHRIVLEIDDAFQPGEKGRLIAMVGYRRREDVTALTHLLDRSPRLGEWRVEVIEGRSHAEVAEILGRTAIFVSTAERDGFGLPGAEALAAGCRLVGFTGDGGAEFFTLTGSPSVVESDLSGLLTLVEREAGRFEQDRAEFDRLTELSRRALRERYTPEAFRESTVTAFEQLVRSSAGQDRSITVRHFGDHARPRSLAQRVRVAVRAGVGAARRSLSQS